eukprot:COSAG06_NODE_12509_length_1372_cov_1.196386_1_plen_139_part_10
MMNPVTTYEMQSGKAAAKAAGARAELEARTGAAASVCRQQTEMARLRHDNRVSAAKEHAAMAQADIEMRMSVLITATQRENREQAEADVRAAFETEAELAAKEREVSTAEADATRAAKDAEAQEHHDQLVARIEADLAP